MKGLLYKDFLNLWKSMRMLFMVFVLVAAFASLADPTSGAAAGMLGFVGCSLAISSVALDERSGWDRFIAAAPLPRWMHVLSKYLLLFVCSSVAFLLSSAFSAVGCTVKGLPLSMEILAPPLLVLAFTLPSISLTLPFLFKFGSEKGRLVLFAIVFIFCAPVLLLITLFQDSISLWTAAHPHLTLLLFGVGGALLALLIVGISFVCSLRIYGQKDL